MQEVARRDAALNPLEVYQADHLFVLVGRNPLPNYIAASLLLKPGGKLYFVYSRGDRGTKDYAVRLARQLTGIDYALIPVNITDPSQFYADLGMPLSQITCGTVGLNYTGGTKFMAVHSYHAIRSHCANRLRAYFTYLDADTLKMRVESEAGDARPPVSVLNSLTGLSLPDLYALHQIRVDTPLYTSPALADIAEALAKLCSTEQGINRWREARKVLQSSEFKWWRDVRANLVTIGIDDATIATIERKLALVADESWDLRERMRHAGCQDDAFKWMDGTWLEEWVLTCVQALEYEHSAANIIGYNPQKFEIDVAMLKGYQLFALSCTMDTDRQTQKLKLFEIYTHARQIGGDEARLALVCATSDPTSLEREIAGEGYRVKVFGLRDLVNLKSKLNIWFRTVD